MTTTVTLRTVWLNDAANPSDRMSFPTMSRLDVTSDVPGEVRRYAGGRLRLVTRDGGTVARTVGLELPHLDREQIDWLQSHVGTLVCVRDDRGRKLWGAYLATGIAESRYSATAASAALEIREITYSERV